jgi:hypothetical protein
MFHTNAEFYVLTHMKDTREPGRIGFVSCSSSSKPAFHVEFYGDSDLLVKDTSTADLDTIFVLWNLVRLKIKSDFIWILV